MNEEAAIRAEDLWMVFGHQARRRFGALRKAHKNAPVPEITSMAGREGLFPAVCNVSFEVTKGELFVIMGLSGSGKSTVLRCISRLLEPTAGSVNILGNDILKARKRHLARIRREKIGMVFQHFGLFPHMTVTDNVAFPLKVQGVGIEERRRRAVEVIGKVGLEGKEEAYPRQLSGGQRQRVGIARSLAVDPDIWLLDEPFSALDPLIRRQLQDEFLNLQSEMQKSIVFITHDITEALKIADRIAIMRSGEIVQIGTPAEIVLSPADDYIAEFSRDISRAKMMHVESLMEPLGSTPLPDSPILKASMSLEDALSSCVKDSRDTLFAVHDGDGRCVGSVSAQKLARAVGEART